MTLESPAVPPRGHDRSQSPISAATTLVAIGNFDGVHLGHRAVIADVAREAHRPGTRPARAHVQSASDRGARARQAPDLDHARAQGRADPPHRFQGARGRRAVHARAREEDAGGVRARADRRPSGSARGHRRARTSASGIAAPAISTTLRELGEELGFEARALPLTGDDHGGYSSSRVREALPGASWPKSSACSGARIRLGRGRSRPRARPHHRRADREPRRGRRSAAAVRRLRLSGRRDR